MRIYIYRQIYKYEYTHTIIYVYIRKPRKKRDRDGDGDVSERVVITEFLDQQEEDDARDESGDDDPLDGTSADGSDEDIFGAGGEGDQDVEDGDVYDYGGVDGVRDDVLGDDDDVVDQPVDQQLECAWPFCSNLGDHCHAVKLAWYAQCELLAAALHEVGAPQSKSLDEAAIIIIIIIFIKLYYYDYYVHYYYYH